MKDYIKIKTGVLIQIFITGYGLDLFFFLSNDFTSSPMRVTFKLDYLFMVFYPKVSLRH